MLGIEFGSAPHKLCTLILALSSFKDAYLNLAFKVLDLDAADFC